MNEKTFSWWKFFVALAFVGGLFVALWVRKPSDEMEIIQGPTMGTVFYVKYFPEDETPERDEIAKNVKRLLKEVNMEMSTYIQESVISKVNRAEVGQWVEVPDDFAMAIEFSLELAKKTQGAFDPTIGPLVNLWGFGPDGIREVPSKEELEKAKEAVGFESVIEYDGENQKIRRLHSEAYLDLAATAKGQGIDVLSRYLDSVGVQDYLIEIGGDITTKGNKRGEDWQIAIEVPRPDKTLTHRVVTVNNMSPVTSGSYRNLFERDGRRYGHIIDFQTGEPVEHQLVSVTVVEKESNLIANGWATAFMALGQEKAMELAEKYDIAAFFISFEYPDEGDLLDSTEKEEAFNGQALPSYVKEGVEMTSSSTFKELFGF